MFGDLVKCFGYAVIILIGFMFIFGGHLSFEINDPQILLDTIKELF